jgi:AmpD protein
MNIDPATGLLDGCTQCPSPNKDVRPSDTAIDLIVIHSISLPPEQYGGDAIERFFQNELDRNEHPYFEQIHDMKVSSHALIKRTGEIIQFVPFNERAWHAGQSCYQGRERCNDFSIGIELEGTDTDAFDELQYQQLAKLITAISEAYPETSGHITGHSDIAPGRKTDPGTGFDWNKLKDYISA